MRGDLEAHRIKTSTKKRMKNSVTDGKSDVYKSIFTSSSSKDADNKAETFLARSVSARGFSLK